MVEETDGYVVEKETGDVSFSSLPTQASAGEFPCSKASLWNGLGVEDGIFTLHVGGGVEQLILLVCPASVQLKSGDLQGKRLLNPTITLKSGKNHVCVPDGDQSGSILCMSLFSIGIVHHFYYGPQLEYNGGTCSYWSKVGMGNVERGIAEHLRISALTPQRMNNRVTIVQVHNQLRF